MRVIVLMTASVGLVGCSPQPRADDPASESPATMTQPTTTASPSPGGPSGAAPAAIALAGEYRVAGVDGSGIDQPYAITASISADRIHVTADCLNFAWDYTVRGGSIATKRAAVEGCARGLTSAEEALVTAFDSATNVERTPANAIELRGSGHSVTLFSQ